MIFVNQEIKKNTYMQKGTIGVTTENIFPIIKKFLYSDHEIFLRELISNATDATQKLKALSMSSEFKGETGDLTVKITADVTAKTISVYDSGIGMTEEEVQKYINQIAFSSAGEFLDKYKDQLNNIIGHFGLGFYSSFMVSKKVEIDTLSWKDGAQPVKWSCEGDPHYIISKGKRKQRGTTVTLYLDSDSEEYAEESKINYLLNKYCKYLPIQIAFGKEKNWEDGKEIETQKDKIINNPTPLWTKKPADLKDEDYLAFYRELYPMQEEPLFHIHLNVDYPFNLTGILYFPKIKEKLEASRNKIQLYCNQVFVTDSVENIVPDFLTLLHGVIDSPDIPLNVSRSYLQSDSNVKKISAHITKKVADRLEDIFKNERKSLEEKWDNLKLFIEYGMLTDEKFFERAEKFSLFKNCDDKYFSYSDYKTAIEANQTDLNKKLVYLYSTNKEEQYTFIESAKNRGYDVLLFDSQLDSHFINLLESKFQNSTFVRVDSDHIDKLIKKEELQKSDLPEYEINVLSSIFQSVLPSTADFNIIVEKLSETDAPLIITQSEFMRRYREMSALNGGMNFYGQLPESYTVTLNSSSEIIKNIIRQKDEVIGKEISKFDGNLSVPKSELDSLKDKISKLKPDDISTADKDTITQLESEIELLEKSRNEKIQDFARENKLINQLCDLALLSNNLLKGEGLSKFVKRSYSLLKD